MTKDNTPANQGVVEAMLFMMRGIVRRHAERLEGNSIERNPYAWDSLAKDMEEIAAKAKAIRAIAKQCARDSRD